MELIYLLPRLPHCVGIIEDSSTTSFCLPPPPDAVKVTLLLSSSTSSSLPLQSPHRLPPCDNIAATVVNASSSSPCPLSLCLPPDLDRARGNWRHTALYLGCARALPHPGVRTLSTGGHQDTALCCHGQVAIVVVAFYAVPCHLNLGAPLLRGRQAAVAAVTALLLCFPPQCCR